MTGKEAIIYETADYWLDRLSALKQSAVPHLAAFEFEELESLVKALVTWRQLEGKTEYGAAGRPPPSGP